MLRKVARLARDARSGESNLNPEFLEERKVRVFVSSTFKDMEQERRELSSKVFPRLRHLCNDRGVSFEDIDLRWGITEEQSRMKEVINVCLTEVENCKPFFIGILGDRYGWIPTKDDVEPDLYTMFPTIKESIDRGTSLTEIEMLHGALNNPKMADCTFFYCKSPSRAGERAIPEEDRSAKAKLADLKGRIAKSGLPVREYDSIEQFSTLVNDDFSQFIRKHFPKKSVNSQWAMERIYQDMIIKNNVALHVRVKKNFSRLEKHFHSSSPPLIVLGETGSGKTALLSTWAHVARSRSDVTLVLFHNLSASKNSGDYKFIVKRILAEIKEYFHLKDDIPKDYESCRGLLPTWLRKAASKGKMVLIIDGINYIENIDGAMALDWLPEKFPRNARVVFSTTPASDVPHSCIPALLDRKYKRFTISKLSKSSAKLLIQEYLSKYSKTLKPELQGKIIDQPMASNPAYLVFLLDELRVVGEHAGLERQIEHLLRAKTLPELYQLFLERLEQEFKDNQKRIVMNTLCLLYISRYGLSESEILEILAIPRALWSPLFFCVKNLLTNRQGILRFSNDAIRKAVEQIYFPDPLQKDKFHYKIANYFSKCTDLQRKAQELSWHLAKGNNQEGLVKAITDPEIIKYAMDNETLARELEIYYVNLMHACDIFSILFKNLNLNTHDFSKEETLEHGDVLIKAAGILLDLQQYHLSEQLVQKCLSLYEKRFGRLSSHLIIPLNNLGLLAMANRGRLGEAENLFKRAYELDTKKFGPDHPEVTTE
nr:DUF4062 domain-containing protein [Candidatus Sigynarchaeota archaeon]